MNPNKYRQTLTRTELRYLAVVINGTKNPCRGAVAKDVVDAILKSRAGEDGHKFARYRNRAEQEERLKDMYEKWARKGNVWSQAAAKVRSWSNRSGR